MFLRSEILKGKHYLQVIHGNRIGAMMLLMVEN
ncbi:hypothetical protein APH_0885 [Anaplasma phagocytophilum str. HZ]|uniref:Uncharacterized protein n=1 Tax=Anaplasma phagocytophilum (strain HZ) TaxID=212042 RepID=Q2GJJ0_ANAPZ|nr:hypothetical protein APH_0885 [Anaplasma phagocytophilum str. HZ]